MSQGNRVVVGVVLVGEGSDDQDASCTTGGGGDDDGGGGVVPLLVAADAVVGAYALGNERCRVRRFARLLMSAAMRTRACRSAARRASLRAFTPSTSLVTKRKSALPTACPMAPKPSREKCSPCSLPSVLPLNVASSVNEWSTPNSLKTTTRAVDALLACAW